MLLGNSAPFKMERLPIKCAEGGLQTSFDESLMIRAAVAPERNGYIVGSALLGSRDRADCEGFV